MKNSQLYWLLGTLWVIHSDLTHSKISAFTALFILITALFHQFKEDFFD